MCIILFLYRVHPEYPLIVAANRDEFYERPAGKPQMLSDDPRSIGGLDLRDKGTWMGANDRGIVVGLTNQRTHQLPDPTLQSRGRVVREALRASSVEEILEPLLTIDPVQYNPFNLLFGDAERLFVAYARRDQARIAIENLHPGVYVLPNDRLGSAEFPKAARVQERAFEVSMQPWTHLRHSLVTILSDHDLLPIDAIPEPPIDSIFTRSWLQRLQAVCIHSESYGTCSSTLIALLKNRVAHYLFAPGPPCQTPFEDVTALLYPALI
jgi:uncharacterized protein with NRDE domain